MTKLNLIYRCCDTVHACSLLKPRIFNFSKQKIVFGCLNSLKKNLEFATKHIELETFVVADKCTDELKEKLKTVFGNSKYEILDEKTGGNAKSFCKCIEIAKFLPDNEIVYFLEDDYLFLRNDVLPLMVFSMNRLSSLENKFVGFTADDYPDRYLNKTLRENSKLRCIETGHFLQIHHTTCTFAMYTNSVKENYANLMKFEHWPFVTEDQCINNCWNGNVPLFSPIPAWTCHFQEDNVIPIYLNRDFLKKEME